MTAPTIFCNECGASNPLQATHCFACNYALRSPVPPSPSQKQVATSNAAILSDKARGPLVHSYLLHSRYSIVKQIGTGGFGAVYKAKDTLFSNRLVAIKEMNQDGLNAQELVEASAAFEREALLLTDLIHPNLPRIHDHFSESGCSYVVMDFIDGDTLEDYLNDRKRSSHRLPVEMVLEIGLQLCTVLDYLHTHEPPIIFRDLKPANIMCTADNHVYLIDFGIARHFKPGKAKDTIPLGSRGYAAPEQYGKAQTTPQSDTYGLGATLHELLTGDDPSLNLFQFESIKIGNSPISTQLDALLKQMVEMEMSKRPANMILVKQELQRLLAQQRPPKTSPVIHRRTFMKGCLSVVATCGVSIGIAAVAVTNPNLVDTLLHHPFVGTTPIPSSSPAPAQDTILSQPLYTYRGHRGSVTDVVWSPGGQLIASAGTLDGSVQVWDANLGNLFPASKPIIDPIERKLLSRESVPVLFATNNQRVDALAWFPDSIHIAAALGNNAVEIWNIETEDNRSVGFRQPGKFSQTGNFNALALSPDGKCIAAISGNTFVQVNSVNSGKVLFAYDDKGESKTIVYSLAWSSDGRLIASGGADGIVRIWNASTGQTYTRYYGHSTAVLSVSWSPDGRHIASGGTDGTVLVWDAATGITLFAYTGHTGGVNAVEWQRVPFMLSRYEARIASAGNDGTVQVWWFGQAKYRQEMAQQDEILIYRGHSGPVTSVTWSPDGQLIASGSEDGTVQIWQAQ